MATPISSAQHYVECENCEENPAQFLCKTCPGHLCETCKTEHETRKITKNHEIIHLHRNREGSLGLLYCGKHTVNKLEWYCSPCKEPVCTKCLMESHNGHKLEDIAATYQDIISKLKEEKEEIEGVLLPKYREMLSKEKSKKSEISKRTDEVKQQIEDHTKSIMDQVTMLKDNAIQNLQEEGKKALELVEDTEKEIERRIETLNRLNEDITNNMGANPGIVFFTNIDANTLQDMQGFPSTVNYKLTDFKPGDLFISEHHFGTCPKFSKSKETNLPTEELSKKNKIVKGMMKEIEDLQLKLETEKNGIARILIQLQIDKSKKALSEFKRDNFE
ncbi:E3 ubiquitin-protein ligase TRIM71-like [Saccostrea echinata]|uniref:E3 ubiquitin-protein ligase TRIM71-like n=1 Tax=Saccostrea echinata TaxID=191078 RepID=UPI002A824B1B|nr:E3 ubiquitin-protein ligase TRIM71-like [Saccostrea echinata]